MKCFVPTCSNKSDKMRSLGISFHKIPQYLKEEWALAIKRSVDDISGDRRICSEHFNETDWFLGNRKILKPGTIPTLKLPTDESVKAKKQVQFGLKFVVIENCSTSSAELNISERTEGNHCEGTVVNVIESETEPSCSTIKMQIPHQDTEELTISTEKLDISSRGIERYQSVSSTTSTTSSNLSRKRKIVKLDHNYSRSTGTLRKQIRYHTENCCVYKSKLKSALRTSARRKLVINHLRDIIFDLKKKHSLLPQRL